MKDMQTNTTVAPTVNFIHLHPSPFNKKGALAYECENQIVSSSHTTVFIPSLCKVPLKEAGSLQKNKFFCEVMKIQATPYCD